MNDNIGIYTYYEIHIIMNIYKYITKFNLLYYNE